ncbi:radical SAM protein [Candidatus Woesearchaeota archaeon]|jgi:AdoMet-dependent heme synthase|nr:radical SAM protein [Candidatus Woesearchaeota archaeon]MBT7366862.1 radical SAM protein [Candidatus Woesearchaeota archaeon]
MEIKVGDINYNTKFQHMQVEITGKCNMRCQHCRAWDEAKVHMSISLFKQCIDFAMSESDSDFRLTISGGEPFMHPNLVECVSYAFEKGIHNMIITTNGSINSKEIIQKLDSLGVPNLSIQISVDSVNSQEHDEFRGFPGAFDKAMNMFDLLIGTNLKAALRSSLTPNTINQVRPLINLALKKKAIRVGLGTVIPAGKGKENTQLILTADKKKEFLEELAQCKKEFTDIDITSEDPLKFNLHDCPWEYGDYDLDDPALFGGCTAGITGFNIDSEGTITPCAVLLKKVVNIKDKSIDEIKEIYSNSDIIKNLFAKKFSGKCGSCKLKRLCGGCRAVADGLSGDYLASDVTCWI